MMLLRYIKLDHQYLLLLIFMLCQGCLHLPLNELACRLVGQVIMWQSQIDKARIIKLLECPLQSIHVLVLDRMMLAKLASITADVTDQQMYHTAEH